MSQCNHTSSDQIDSYFCKVCMWSKVRNIRDNPQSVHSKEICFSRRRKVTIKRVMTFLGTERTSIVFHLGLRMGKCTPEADQQNSQQFKHSSLRPRLTAEGVLNLRWHFCQDKAQKGFVQLLIEFVRLPNDEAPCNRCRPWVCLNWQTIVPT